MASAAYNPYMLEVNMWTISHIKYRSLALMVQPEQTSLPSQKLKILKASGPLRSRHLLSVLQPTYITQKIEMQKVPLFWLETIENLYQWMILIILNGYSVSSLVVQISVKPFCFSIPKFQNRLPQNWLDQISNKNYLTHCTAQCVEC